ncbi:MAG TPA: PQQ-binding-like beta-propeller repeat protein [Iamia sp.]
MSPGRARDPDHDVAALEAVWGREASATAPPAPRPDLDAILAADTSDTPDGPGAPTRGRRPLVLAGALLAVAGAAVASLVLLGDDDDPAPDRAGDRPTTVPATTDAVLGEPAWTASVACRPAPDEGSAPICPVATDDERAYVLAGAGDGSVVQARALADGSVVWEASFPEGAFLVRRLPSTVLVLGVGPDWLTVALDPVTGVERWRAPGSFVEAIGRDHVLLDRLVGAEIEERGSMSVLDAATGQVVLAREGTPAGLYIHPCGAAGLALVRQDGRLTAVGVPDGVERWSVPVLTPLDAFQQVHCDDRSVAYIDSGELHLLDVLTGTEIGSRTIAVRTTEDPITHGRVTVLGVVAGTVVVGAPDGARGFQADGDLSVLWEMWCHLCGPELPTGPAGEDVVVLVNGEAVVQTGADGTPGPTLDLDGHDLQVLDDGTLVAWGADGVVVADTADLGRAVLLEEGDVRQAAAGAAHLVVTTADEVRAYPLEG